MARAFAALRIVADGVEQMSASSQYIWRFERNDSMPLARLLIISTTWHYYCFYHYYYYYYDDDDDD